MKRHTTPTLLVDKNRCLKNIQSMLDKAEQNQIELRPHFKTHQSHEVGRWFRNLGVKKIAVSSLRMAAYFAADGWKDITVAFPTNILEIDLINALASKIKLNLLIQSKETFLFLEERNEIIIYGGGIHFSKEVYTHSDYGTCYGWIVADDRNGWSSPIPDVYLSRLSQEHGVISCSDAFINNFSIGQVIKILPVHSCMTANLLQQMFTTEGKRLDMMPILYNL